jgi:hypothetical protein
MLRILKNEMRLIDLNSFLHIKLEEVIPMCGRALNSPSSKK